MSKRFFWLPNFNCVIVLCVCVCVGEDYCTNHTTCNKYVVGNDKKHTSPAVLYDLIAGLLGASNARAGLKDHTERKLNLQFITHLEERTVLYKLFYSITLINARAVK